MPISKPFVLATEGPTIDKRFISRADIETAAKNYDPKVYTAICNLEHLVSLSPESVFRSYGKIVSLSTREAEVLGEKKLQLMAVVDVDQEVVDMQSSYRKAFPSMEIQPDFLGKGIPYITGMGFTDQPASIGTETMKFSAFSCDKSNVYSFANEITLEFDNPQKEDEPGIGAKLLASVKELLSRKGSADKQEFGAIGEAVQEVAGSQAELLEKFAKLQGDLEKATQDLAAAQKQIKEGAEAFAAFKEQLDQTEAPGQQRRPAADGGNGTIRTDC